MSLWRKAPAALLLLLTLLLLTRPYAGIRHDSILYLGQALALRYPAQFGKDLFFEFGSQSRFTIFPTLAAWLLRHVQAGTAFLWLTLLGRVTFCVASWVLLRRLYASSTMAFWALICLLVMPAGYGGFGLLSYAEPFLTGRTFAEPLALLSLACFMSRRYVISLLLWLLSASIHPLMALPALAVGWCWLVLQDRRWLHTLWLGVPVLFAATLGVAPLDKLLQRYDAQWLQWIWEPNKMVFERRWPAAAWCYLATDAFLVWRALRRTPGPFIHLAKAVLLATAICSALSLLLADWLNLVIPTGLQLWRTQWLLHWLAMAALPYLFSREVAEASGRWTRPLLLAGIALMGAPMGHLGSPWPVPLLMALYLAWPHLQPHVGRATTRLLDAGVVAALCMSAAKFCYVVIRQFALSGSSLSTFRLDSILIGYPLFLVPLILGGASLWYHKHAARPGIVLCLVAALIWFAAHWDARNTRSRIFENWSASQASPFGPVLPAGAQVYWQDELLAPWLVLHRPSYYSDEQRAGLLFNRGTAQAASARQNVMQIIEIQSQFCTAIGAFTGTSKNSANPCQIDSKTIADVCAESRGDLSYLVLPHRLEYGVQGHWQIPARAAGEKNIDYYLYRCSDWLPAPSQDVLQ